MEFPRDHLPKIKINQRLSPPTPTQTDAAAVCLTVLPRGPRTRSWPQPAPAIPYGDVLKARWRRRPEDLLETDLPNTAGTRVVLGLVDPAQSAFGLLTQARRLAARALDLNPRTLMVHVAGFAPATAARIAEALCAALLAAAAPLPSLKRRPPPVPALGTINLYGLEQRVDLARTRAEALGNHLARWLTTLPGNTLPPGRFRQLASALARREGWRAEFLDLAALKRRKAGAFLAVAQGSAEADAGILHLRYRPGGRSRGGGLALVGKGICFDTGGVNLKSARSMHGMHEDMAGAAVALGTLLALSELAVDHPVDCWLALAQNHIGPRAYKPNDVVTAGNGVRIEVVHTDAEGRMVLADTLALAAKTRPALLIDYATLTGSCVAALSSRYSGVLSNRDALWEPLLRAGRDSGERVWPFPMDADYDNELRSPIADIKQCTLDNEADHILAARFLNRFVPESLPWVHLDLASASRRGGLAHIPSATTGFGVRYTLQLLAQGVLDPAAGRG